MEIETVKVTSISAIASGIAWPIAFVVVIFMLKNTISTIFTRLKGVEGPTGWKLLFEMRRVGERLERLESATADIYNLSGEPLKVREEIFEYVANIINNASESTALEMRTELNKYHLEHLPVKIKVSEIKSMLKKLRLYKTNEPEENKLNEDITPEFIKAVFEFQNKHHMKDADGIIGPKTIKILLEKAGKDA